MAILVSIIGVIVSLTGGITWIVTVRRRLLNLEDGLMRVALHSTESMYRDRATFPDEQKNMIPRSIKCVTCPQALASAATTESLFKVLKREGRWIHGYKAINNSFLIFIGFYLLIIMAILIYAPSPLVQVANRLDMDYWLLAVEIGSMVIGLTLAVVFLAVIVYYIAIDQYISYYKPPLGNANVVIATKKIEPDHNTLIQKILLAKDDSHLDEFWK